MAQQPTPGSPVDRRVCLGKLGLAGIISYTWIDVFVEALSKCQQDARFRESLPVGFAQ
jgi:hypothetical protein